MIYLGLIKYYHQYHFYISDTVIEILSDYENYKVIAENGRQHIIDKFNWPKITRQYEEVILRTIQNYKNVNF